VNVFAVNGSARLERGHTAVILNAFLEGVKKSSCKNRTILLAEIEYKTLHRLLLLLE
jgi:multimeric flavodoxin WrbA